MPVLALDTSSSVAVALTDETGRTLAARSAPEQRHHAELLAPMIDAVLTEAGVDRTQVTAVVAGTGPAPYTGLRVGLVTARTLALALGVPVQGVSSLDALAAEAADRLGLAVGDEVLVASDARRREVYWARYRVTAAGDGAAAGADTATGDGAPTAAGLDAATPSSARAAHTGALVELVSGPSVGSAASVAAEGRAAGAVVVGRGALQYAADLPPAEDGPLDPDPAVLARLALARLAAAPAGTLLPSEPLYLRRPDAVPPAERKRALA
ncbi:tRNA (adenosine(37)-N6)-threonylcarbamoyltransferase complex dimerization subunit type 1 TsaB [Cellulomonas cellasea]|uniref:tRNA (Adenosine(37)-N6)-threonylcarbamoyltransferase complex dimerization subunit type 1 TsaB n=1 Tax=Cellulomonas cellasea TaxID=43670 RepID=A0A4Y3KQC5_9CELL|nr:tRNA (adenosine(37)-N6)-threonylcarbamoyltransferase complex dimerization subunit type 1 TsaB [Cellulomonas cellasea]GEA86262.1 tRNA (adenosine(37)-N6)-threonylcarbamoyltransferase complex dimerization subunit type 1 TsaB [Cellulomonas cellasea]